MGVFADILSNSVSIDRSVPITALDQQAVRLLKQLVAEGDATLPTVAAPANEQQVLYQFASNPTGNTYGFDVTLDDGTTFTVTGINYTSTSIGIVQVFLDVQATSAIPGYTNGDIVVSGQTLIEGDMVLTFSGASVSGRNHQQTVTDLQVAIGGTLADPAQGTITNGQPARDSWGGLVELGVVPAVSVPPFGEDAVPFQSPMTAASSRYSPALIKALAEEAAAQDNNRTTYEVILASVGLV